MVNENPSKDGKLELATQEALGARVNRILTSEPWSVYSNINIMKEDGFRDIVTEHVTSLYEKRTPEEKIKKRPDGFDYIESVWMDKTFKEFSPIYEYSLLHVNESLGWIDIVVSLKDRVTGNVELGAGSARIQVKKGTGNNPGFQDLIDKGNNLKSALTNACKNAQSRFGTGADVYGKRESTRTPDEIKRYQQMLSAIKRINPSRAQMFETQWNDLGVDFTEFLDRWQVFVDRYTPAEDISDNSLNGEREVTGESPSNQRTSTVSNTAETKVNKIKI